jgi:hypothetical protein
MMRELASTAVAGQLQVLFKEFSIPSFQLGHEAGSVIYEVAFPCVDNECSRFQLEC